MEQTDNLNYRDAKIKCCATCRFGNEWGHPSYWQGHCDIMAQFKVCDVVDANFVCDKYTPLSR